jgi:Tfp pilus assembly protein PilO
VLGAAVILWAVIEWVVFPVYDTLKAAPASAQEKEELLKKYRAVLDRRGVQTQAINALTKDVNQLQTFLIRADNASLASQEFQSLVEQAASLSNISIAQRSISPARTKDALSSEMNMTLNFECAPSQLAAFLSTLRNLPKIVTVRLLQISPAQMVFEPPQRGELNKRVRVNLTLAALAVVPIPSTAARPAVNQGQQTK